MFYRRFTSKKHIQGISFWSILEIFWNSCSTSVYSPDAESRLKPWCYHPFLATFWSLHLIIILLYFVCCTLYFSQTDNIGVGWYRKNSTQSAWLSWVSLGFVNLHNLLGMNCFYELPTTRCLFLLSSDRFKNPLKSKS